MEKKIEHVGILGMKWGHRKSEGSSSSKSSKGLSDRQKIHRTTLSRNEQIARQMAYYKRPGLKFRIGKKKGESNEHFDARWEKEMWGKVSQSSAMKKRVAEIQAYNTAVEKRNVKIALGLLGAVAVADVVISHFG